MAFRGFIDDSGEGDAPGDPVFVLGGFIASTERWAAFSREWRNALDKSPSIGYFKMAEAANLSAKGQFARRLGWTEATRDAKLELLTDVIVRHVEAKVNWSVDKVAFAYWAQLRGLRLYMDAAFVLPQLKPVGFAIRTHAPSHRYGFGVVFTS